MSGRTPSYTDWPTAVSITAMSLILMVSLVLVAVGVLTHQPDTSWAALVALLAIAPVGTWLLTCHVSCAVEVEQSSLRWRTLLRSRVVPLDQIEEIAVEGRVALRLVVVLRDGRAMRLQVNRRSRAKAQRLVDHVIWLEGERAR
jgi:hypothetical protein